MIFYGNVEVLSLFSTFLNFFEVTKLPNITYTPPLDESVKACRCFVSRWTWYVPLGAILK